MLKNKCLLTMALLPVRPYLVYYIVTYRLRTFLGITTVRPFGRLRYLFFCWEELLWKFVIIIGKMENP